MTIGEFSKKTNLTKDTLRYYDKIGLLHTKYNGKNREYGEFDLEKARIIKKLKNLKFSLEEIKMLFQLDEMIGDVDFLDDDKLESVKDCVQCIIKKQEEMIQQEKDLLAVKSSLERMIQKTEKLLESGYLPEHTKECGNSK